MRKNLRLKEIKFRKNFFPTLLITSLLWGVLGAMVYFVDPEALGIVPLFFVTIFIALLFTFSLVFANTRRGVITAIGLTTFLILRYLGVGNILNFLLIAGITLTIELFFSVRSS